MEVRQCGLELTVTAALTGATVWGPAAIPTSTTLGAFTEIVAGHMGVCKFQVVLFRGDATLSGVTLSDAGVKDGDTLLAALCVHHGEYTAITMVYI